MGYWVLILTSDTSSLRELSTVNADWFCLARPWPFKKVHIWRIPCLKSHRGFKHSIANHRLSLTDLSFGSTTSCEKKSHNEFTSPARKHRDSFLSGYHWKHSRKLVCLDSDNNKWGVLWRALAVTCICISNPSSYLLSILEDTGKAAIWGYNAGCKKGCIKTGQHQIKGF